MRSTPILCLLLLMLTATASAQKGDWYTYSTGKSALTHISLKDDELLFERTDPAFRQVKLMGRTAKQDEMEKMEVLKKVTANDRIYLIHQSWDSLFFCTTFKYFKQQDSLLMYCADGVDDGYRSIKDALNAIKKDTGTHFSITLYRKEKLEMQRRRTSVAKITAEEFRITLEQFNQQMDQFWQYRGYGRYEPYHAWVNLIYGNAWAQAFDPKFNKLSLDAKNLKKPIAEYGKDPAIKALLESAGLLETQQ